MSDLSFNLQQIDVLEKIRAAKPAKGKIYLVGGAVRDLLGGRSPHDFDFILPAGVRVIPLARSIAKSLQADFYPLDSERDTGRVILTQGAGERLFLDFAAQRGEDIAADLRLRDFTINAIAIDLDYPEQIIDPLGGARDIFSKTLRACSEQSMLSDPVRALRGVRMAVNYELKMLPETRQLIRQAIPHLCEISPERLRDEIFHLLGSAKPDVAMRTLDALGAIPQIFPELEALKNLQQPPPHLLDGWNHTLAVVQNLARVLSILGPVTETEAGGNITAGWISLRLGRFRQQIIDHFAVQLNPDRSLKSLLFLAALYHDAGKPQKQSSGEQGEIHFYRHEEASRAAVERRTRALHLSNQEIERAGLVVSGHMRPFSLNASAAPLTRRAIYRFWRDLADAGVDVCLLSLADMLGIYGATLPTEQLTSHLDTLRNLLEAWWEQKPEIVNPPVLLDGNKVMQAFQLQPGPIIGQLLEAVREAQAEGKVLDLDQALKFAGDWLKSSAQAGE